MAETTEWCSHCQFITFITFLFTVNVIRQMVPLFSKVDSNKLWHDVQHEENVIYAQFFWTHSVLHTEGHQILTKLPHLHLALS